MHSAQVTENPQFLAEVEAAGHVLLQRVLCTAGNKPSRLPANLQDALFDRSVLDNCHFMASNTGEAPLM